MTNQKTGVIIAVGGGKGGVGKSVLSIGLGVALAREGRSVVLADLDLGAANLHTYLGIRGRIPGIADFLLGRAASLEEILVETPVPRLGLISGAEFVPGITSPAHWKKMKLMRRLRSLPADAVIIDLGAGVHFNTLDFFGVADRGVVITAPEPGAVMNAYSFIKGALFRKIQSVFRNHPGLSGLLDEANSADDRGAAMTLERYRGRVADSAPELSPLIDELEQSFRPLLVINRAPAGRTHLLVRNLIDLCREKLGVTLDHAGDLPDTPEMSNHLLNVPGLFDRPGGGEYFSAAQRIAGLIEQGGGAAAVQRAAFDYNDDEIAELSELIDSLDERVFAATNRTAWKLRLFFKPGDVANFLISRGITHELFYKHA